LQYNNCYAWAPFLFVKLAFAEVKTTQQDVPSPSSTMERFRAEPRAVRLNNHAWQKSFQVAKKVDATMAIWRELAPLPA
jgi:hypothetical protein